MECPATEPRADHQDYYGKSESSGSSRGLWHFILSFAGQLVFHNRQLWPKGADETAYIYGDCCFGLRCHIRPCGLKNYKSSLHIRRIQRAASAYQAIPPSFKPQRFRVNSL
ncbi:hypothetical protein ACU8KH_03382 [Lachancea thermotolerans]